MAISVVLIEPDIPQNTGAIMRLCACLNIELHLIEPFGFIWDEKKMKQAGLDYLPHCHYHRHLDRDQFWHNAKPRRTILFTTHADKNLSQLEPHDDDFLLFGNESQGAPQDIHRRVDERVKIPMAENRRSLNLATAIAFSLGFYHHHKK